jgi:hypothetical protein
MNIKLFAVAIFAAFALSACVQRPPTVYPGATVDVTGKKPQLLERRERVAGGECVAVLRYNPLDERSFTVEVDKAASENSNCLVEDAKDKLFVNGQPLQHAESITFGTGTTTCYGPPIPSPPRCVCTRRPCP